MSGTHAKESQLIECLEQSVGTPVHHNESVVTVNNVILSSDCGVSVLPKPVDGLKIFIHEVLKLGFTIKDIDNMTKTNPQILFYEQQR